MNAQNLWELLVDNKNDTNCLKSLIDTYPKLINNTSNMSTPMLIRSVIDAHYNIFHQLMTFPEIYLDIRDASSNTALMRAIRNDQPDMAVRLIEAGAKVALKNAQSKNALDYLSNILDKTSRDKVELAIKNKMEELANKPVVSLGTSHITIDALFSLLVQNRTNANLLELLINTHKDIINDKMTSVKYGILIHSILKGFSTIVCCLIKCPTINLNITDAFNTTALSTSILRNEPNIAMALISAGADVTIKDVFGKTAFDGLVMIETKESRNEVRQLLESKMVKLEETSKPVKEISKLVEETPKPIEETPTPVEETSKPVEETSKHHPMADTVLFMMKNKINFTYKDNSINSSCFASSEIVEKVITAVQLAPSIVQLVHHLLENNTNFTYTDGQITIG